MRASIEAVIAPAFPPGIVSWQEPERAFCRATEEGQHALSDGDLARAEHCFRIALGQAERLLEEAERAGGTAILLAPMMLTTGRRNLAEVRHRGGDAAGARRHLESAVEDLLSVAAHAGRPPALRLNCVRHLRHALGFLAQGGGPAGVARSEQFAERTARVGREVVRVAMLCQSPAMRSHGVRPS